jgi:hypothetical protein
MKFAVAPGQDGELCSLDLQYRVCAFVRLCVHMSKNLREIISFGVCTVINLTCAHKRIRTHTLSLGNSYTRSDLHNIRPSGRMRLTGAHCDNFGK